jgi:hypothetical protein
VPSCTFLSTCTNFECYYLILIWVISLSSNVMEPHERASMSTGKLWNWVVSERNSVTFWIASEAERCVFGESEHAATYNASYHSCNPSLWCGKIHWMAYRRGAHQTSMSLWHELKYVSTSMHSICPLTFSKGQFHTGQTEVDSHNLQMKTNT